MSGKKLTPTTPATQQNLRRMLVEELIESSKALIEISKQQRKVTYALLAVLETEQAQLRAKLENIRLRYDRVIGRYPPISPNSKGEAEAEDKRYEYSHTAFLPLPANYALDTLHNRYIN